MTGDRSLHIVLWPACVHRVCCALTARHTLDLCTWRGGEEEWEAEQLGVEAECVSRERSGWLQGMHMIPVARLLCFAGHLCSRVGGQRQRRWTREDWQRAMLMLLCLVALLRLATGRDAGRVGRRGGGCRGRARPRGVEVGGGSFLGEGMWCVAGWAGVRAATWLAAWGAELAVAGERGLHVTACMQAGREGSKCGGVGCVGGCLCRCECVWGVGGCGCGCVLMAEG